DSRCLLGQEREDGLGDVFGEVRVDDVTPGRAVDQVDVAGDEAREGGLRPVAGVLAEELEIGGVGWVVVVHRATPFGLLMYDPFPTGRENSFANIATAFPA